jgi:hypothetical protein
MAISKGNARLTTFHAVRDRQALMNGTVNELPVWEFITASLSIRNRNDKAFVSLCRAAIDLKEGVRRCQSHRHAGRRYVDDIIGFASLQVNCTEWSFECSCESPSETDPISS